jgi:hypothetical protein
MHKGEEAHDDLKSAMVVERLEYDEFNPVDARKLLLRPLHTTKHRRLRKDDTIVHHDADLQRTSSGKSRRPREREEGGVEEVRLSAPNGRDEEVDVAGGAAHRTGRADDRIEAVHADGRKTISRRRGQRGGRSVLKLVPLHRHCVAGRTHAVDPVVGAWVANGTANIADRGGGLAGYKGADGKEQRKRTFRRRGRNHEGR